MMMTFLRAWLFGVALLFGGIVAIVLGVPKLIWESDPTYLTWVILAMGVALSCKMLFLTFKFSKGLYDKTLDDLSLHIQDVYKDVGWVGSSLASRLGFMGTGIGMIIALSAFKGLDLNDPASLQSVLANAFVGVKAALLTTIAGLVVNIALSIFSFNLGQAVRIEKLKRDDKTENTFPTSV